MRIATGLFGVPLLLGMLVAFDAGAQGGDPAVEREARARFQEGLTRVQARDFEGARVAFTQAFAVLHKPDILWNLALSEEKSGHLVDALGHFQQLDRELPSSADHAPPKKHADDLAAQTGHVDVTAPSGAAITVDGGPERVAPLDRPWDVMPGHHVVNVRVGGAPAKSLEVDAFAGRTVKADFGQVDTPAPPVPPGPGGATSTQPGDTGAPPAPPPPAPETPSSGGNPTGKLVTVIAVGGAAVLSAGLAIGFGAASSSAAKQAQNDQNALGNNPSGCKVPSAPCSDLQSQRNTQSTDHGISTGMWITAGVLAAADVGIWFLWPRSSPSAAAATPPAARVQVVPSVGAGGAGLFAVGTF
ncbi:MAG TPA: hypothetical protein VIF09_00875 [Polyangiaceae bacterium]